MVASGHFQDSIEPPSAFDVVALILWSRLGTCLPERTAIREYRGIDGRCPVTGTEWEFEDGLQAARKSGAPDLLVYRCRKPAPFDTRDPAQFERQAEQLKALNSFWERHFANQGKFIGAYTSFTSDAEFAAAFEGHLRKLIERRIAKIGARPGVAPTTTQAPFRGLESYEYEHAPIFFGQDEALTRAMVQLTAHAEAGSAFLIVLGASGSGKSSLVKAGMLPKLFVPRRVAGAAFLRRVVFRPSDATGGEDLFDALARVLTTQVSTHEGLSEILGPGQSVANFAAHLRDAGSTPAYPIATALGQLTLKARQTGHVLEYESAKLVLVVDQLEELFTNDRLTTDERVHFIDLLAGLVRSGAAWVIATMRKDFWHRADETPELIRLADGGGRLELLAPTPAQLGQMIRRPAEAAGVHFEVNDTSGFALHEVIAQEVAQEPGALPLLSYVLDQLYRSDVVEGHGHTLTYATYERLGRLVGAIATKAEAVLSRCAAEDRESLGSVLFALVSIGAGEGDVDRAVARRVPLATFPPGTPHRRLVDAFLDSDARLLVTDTGSSGTPLIRVAHEALISHWDRARQYVENNAEALKIRRRVEERHRRWLGLQEVDRNAKRSRVAGWIRAQFGREPGLLTDVDVADGRRLLAEHRGDTESHLVRYIERSVADERRRRSRVVRVLSFIMIVVAALAAIAFRQRNVAESESAIANRTTRFMVSLFENADPSKSRGATITVRELLDQGAKTIGSEPDLRNAPRIRAELQTTIGQAYMGLGLYLAAANQLAEARIDEQETSVPAATRIRTLVASGTTLYLSDDDAGALRFLEPAVDLARKALSPANQLRSQALTALGDVLVDTGKYDQAQLLYQEALTADRKRPATPENEAVLANTLESLATEYYYRGNLAAAEAPMREALRLRERAFGMIHPMTAQSMNNLGVLLYQSGQYDAAMRQYQQALPIYEQVYGPQHPEVASLLNNMGRSALMAGNVEQAEPLMRKSLAMTERFEDPKNEELVFPLNSLAMIDAYHDHTALALQEAQRAESIARLPDHGELLDQVLLTEAGIELSAGDQARAASLLAESKALLTKAHPYSQSEAWRYAVWDMVDARLAARHGDRAGALKTIAAAQKVIEERFGPTSFYGEQAQQELQRLQQIADAPQQ
ncbi:MAG TPA: tetratricopeptide repeat protein [Steroidobacteraceae bacterium]|nr:tetratricopeptide repeat protein [Steroidobacteraceae bacterium]